MGNIRATIQGEKNGESEISLLSMQDYYPFGSPMPGRSITNTSAYKQGYQGQQVDGETSFNAFELRLYDSRLGGWLTPDPYRQHLSPYMAMSNNPFSFIDPDGGWDEEHGNGEGFNGDQLNTFAMIDELYDQCPRCTAEEVGMMLDSYNRLGFVNPELLQEIGTSTVYNGSERDIEWHDWPGIGRYGRVKGTKENYITVNNGKLTNGNNGAQGGGYENYGAGEGNITPAGFDYLYRGMTENQIMIGQSSFMGYTYSNDVRHRNSRFVMLVNGNEVDMVHFMVVGRAGHALGLGNELHQAIRVKSSAFNPQDLYSNRLGVNFFRVYGSRIQQNPTRISGYIYEYFNSPEVLNPPSFQPQFPTGPKW